MIPTTVTVPTNFSIFKSEDHANRRIARARETMGSKLVTAVKKSPALRLQRRPTAKTTGLLDKFKVSRLTFGVGVPSATFTSGEGRSEQLRLTRDKKWSERKITLSHAEGNFQHLL